METLSTMFERASLKRVKNSSFGGCIVGRREIFPAAASQRAFPSTAETRKESIPLPCHSQYIAYRRACCKTRIVPHNRQRKPEPTEMGETICVGC
jgi:hypothetical protein